MNLPKIKLPEKLTVGVGTAMLKIKDKSPEILLVCGVATMAGAVFSAVKAAREHDALIADHEDRLEAAKCEYVLPVDGIEGPDEDGNYILSDGVTVAVKSEKEIARQVRKEYFKTLAKFMRLYGRTAALMAISATCFIAMHNIQSNRIAGLTAAYTGLREYISAYEKRNIELNGQKSHEMCKYGYKEVEVEEEDPDTGEMVKEKKKVPAYEGLDDEEMRKQPFHDQCFVFSKETAPGAYIGIANSDICTLTACQNFIINRVRTQGWAIVNDALGYLGMEKTTEGMIEGWVKGCGEDPNLGFEDPINNRFLAGYNHEEVYLDFNVHGNVFALLKEKEEKERLKMAELKAKRLAEEAAI